MSSARYSVSGTTVLVIKILLIATGLFLTNHSIVERLDYFLDFKLFFPLMVFLAIWLTALIAIFYIAFTPRKPERVIWSVLICLAVFLGETYYLVSGEHLTIGALDAMWSPSLVNLEIVAFYGKYFFEALLRTATLLVGLLIPFPAARMLRWRSLAVIPLVPYLLLSGLIYYVGAAQSLETSGMPSQFLIPGQFSFFAVSKPQSLEKLDVDIPISESSGLQHIILIVDESVSGDFIDLNVPRGTTPFLVSQAGSLANFGLALSASNCSTASNAILRLGANPDTLGAGDSDILTNPSIWKYAKKAGFETSYIEAQYISSGHLNFMNATELALIDNILTYSSDTEKNQRDARLVEQISKVLSRPQPQFVYVNKYGVHFPYHSSYPDSETIFRPAMQPYKAIKNREQLVNSYKNAIRWSVDRFIETLLGRIDLSNSVLIYTSDHGQNLLDDGIPTTHCRRSKESLYEAIVPLLVWTGNKQLALKFGRAAVENHDAASHFEIFPTILQLFGYDPSVVERRYHQNLFKKINTPLGFTSGPVMGRFGRRATWHTREGLSRLDR